ncbi:MAG: class I SAM-dependent methyltransferase [Bacteroidota bacterium]|nr:class I SAM-dependent methyltransferase [Bacteroidota bacterium]MDP3557026.1 class I SAM-dependent methyltransferase [Bacteroidota bacterium]
MASKFIDDKSYKNLEIGAGCGDFGSTYHPKCYLTDGDSDLNSRCKENSVHHFCQGNKLPWGENRFEIVIMCNPYLYGFKDYEDSVPLLNEIIRVLKNNGKLIVLGRATNPYCIGYRINETVNKVNIPNVTLIYNEENINSTHEYSNYVFKRMDNSDTIPDKRYTIQIDKV